MKATWILLVTVALMLGGCGSRESADEAPRATDQAADTTDAPAAAAAVTPLQTLLGDPETFVGQTLIVEGHVTGRCMGTGCWVSLDTGDPQKPFYAKSPDHSFTFPEECMGQHVRVSGVLMVKRPAGQGRAAAGGDLGQSHAGEGEHGAEEQGHVCPQPVYFLNPTGVGIQS